MARKKSRKWIGIRRKRRKWEAYVDVAGERYRELFALTTDPDTMQAWREKTRKKYARVAPADGSFAADIVDYLAQVAAKPTIGQITAHLDLWADALGRDRPRTSITKGEINKVMQAWLQTPTNQPDPTIRGRRGRPSGAVGLSPGAVKKRRGTLRRFFNVMNGPDDTNPVKGTTCGGTIMYEDPRGLPLADAVKIIEAMPVRVRRRKGLPYEACKARLRAAFMLWTGWPQEAIRQIKPTDFVLTAAVPFARGRRRHKGAGVEARDIPLCAQAVEAARAFAGGGAFGRFASGSFNVSVKRAAVRAGVPVPEQFHAYDLRHTFGSGLAEAGVGDAQIAWLMMHAEHSTIGRRYRQASNRAVSAQSIARFGAFAPALQSVQPTVQNMPAKRARVGKSRERKRLRRAS